MTATSTNIPQRALPTASGFSAGFKNFVHRFLLIRELSALRQASQQIRNPEIFNARIKELKLELYGK